MGHLLDTSAVNRICDGAAGIADRWWPAYIVNGRATRTPTGATAKAMRREIYCMQSKASKQQ